MKKSYLILAAAAIFAACSSDDGLTNEQQTAQVVDDGGIYFDVYVNRGLSRAGSPKEITSASLKTGDHKTDGFGVFGFYTNNVDYSKYSTPNFMYNQQVTYSGGAWTYAPIKYWPNEFKENALSVDQDKLSFFAYAPYVPVEPSTGLPTGDKTKNITRLTSNTETGDPCIKYIVDTDPKTSVDLLWGVAPATSTYETVSGPSQSTVTEGKAYTNLLKSTVPSKVNFNLRHALAQLSVSIDAFVDGTDNSNALDANTRIFVRSITFTGFATQGSLNLNNSSADKPSWFEYDGIKEIPTGTSSEDITFYDGRRDGKEGSINGELSNEKPTGLNLSLIQNERTINTSTGNYATANNTHDASTCVPSGVTETTVNLFETDQDGNSPIYVIPTDQDLSVTIVYDVETIDPNVAEYLSDGITHGSTIENRIFKENVFGAIVEAGKAYQLKLHLGMTSVKFDAVVLPWGSLTSTEVDLPHNSPSGVASGETLNANMDAAGGTYNFALIGGTGNLTQTGSTTTIPDGNASKVTDVGGTADNGAITISANNTINNITYTINVEDESGTPKTATIIITQAAHALELATSETYNVDTYELANDDANFVLTTTADYDWSSPAATIVVEDASAPGVELVSGTDYTWDAATQTITITGAMPTTGNNKTFIVKVTAGDVEDSIKVKVTKTT